MMRQAKDKSPLCPPPNSMPCDALVLHTHTYIHIGALWLSLCYPLSSMGSWSFVMALAISVLSSYYPHGMQVGSLGSLLSSLPPSQNQSPPTYTPCKQMLLLGCTVCPAVLRRAEDELDELEEAPWWKAIIFDPRSSMLIKKQVNKQGQHIYPSVCMYVSMYVGLGKVTQYDVNLHTGLSSRSDCDIAEQWSSLSGRKRPPNLYVVRRRKRGSQAQMNTLHTHT